MIKNYKRKTLIGALITATCAFTLAGCATEASANLDLREYFNVPSSIQTTAYVGAETELAYVTANEAYAQDFKLTVLNPAGEEVALDGYSFTPTEAGDYNCTYSYVCNGEAYAYTYTLAVTVKDGPVFQKDPSLPYAYLAGREYVLPALYAKDYKSGVESDIAISVKCSGEEVTVVDGAFTPVYDGVGSEVEITYVATSGNKTESIVETLPILNPFDEQTGKVDVTELFVATGFESSKVTAEGVSFTAVSETELQYANYMISDGTTFAFGFGDKSGAEALTVKFESVEKPSVYTTVRFEKGKQASGAGKIVLNGGSSVDYTFAENDYLQLSYDKAKNRFMGAGGEELFKVTSDANGNPFNGFPGELVKVSVAVEGVYGDCDVNVYKIASQNLGGLEYDSIEPTIYRQNTDKEFTLGEIITLKGAFAVDVIDPVSTIKVTVRNSAGIVKDVNGTPILNVDGKKDISFKAELCGQYRIETTVEDGSGNRNLLPNYMNLYVYDYNPPEIIVNGNIVTTVKLGQTITFPEITAMDAESGNKIKLQLCVIWPTLKMYQIAVDNDNKDECVIRNAQCEFDEVGTYRIRIIATDESGNYTRKEFTVVCEA